MQATQTDVKGYLYFAGNRAFEVHEPYSGKLFVRAAVDAAAKAFPGWAESTPAESARLFLKSAEVVTREPLSVPSSRATPYGTAQPDDFSDVIWIHSHSGQKQYPF